MNTNLSIDKEFNSLIPPLTEDEYAQLEQNILQDGRCRDAVTVWNGMITDGHNRYEICKKHGVPFDVVKQSFSSKTEAKAWIIQNQLGRRNLTDAMRIELALSKQELLRKAAGNRTLSAGPVNARKDVSAEAGVSETTVHKYIKIKETGNRELLDQVQKGDVRIGAAYRQLEATVTTVTEFNLEDDDENQLRVIQAVNGHIEKIGRLYQFVSDAVSLSDGNSKTHFVLRKEGASDIAKLLKKQSAVLAGLCEI